MPRAPIPNPPYRGGCLCGAVRYRIDAKPRALNACHCMDCKKLSGATHIVMAIVDTDAFAHEAGELVRWRKTADSGREVDIVRCAQCGVRLWHEPLANPEFRFVAMGTLDDPSWTEPTSHIWLSRVSPGVYVHEDAYQADVQPLSRQVLIDAFSKHHG
ncbi:MAG: GFA family protein [Caulobacterales bacterium]